MVFQDVEVLPSRASFSTTFLINCGSGGSRGTTTCVNTVVRGEKGYVKYICSTYPLFVSVEFNGDCKRATNMR